MKKVLKFSQYIIAITLLFFVLACSVEESAFTGKKSANEQKLSWTAKTFKELRSDLRFLNAYGKVDRKINEQRKSLSNRSVMEEMYNFTIDSTIIYEVNRDNYTSYTFEITRDSTPLNYFENLFIEIDSTNETTATLLKYNVDPNTNDVFSIDATRIIYNPATALQKASNGNIDCTTISVYYVETCGCVGHHWPGDASCTCWSDPPTSILINSYTTCESSGGGSGGGSGESGGGTPSTNTITYNLNEDGGWSYSTYSYSVTRPFSFVSQRKKSLKQSFPVGLGLNSAEYQWLLQQDENTQGIIYDYLESQVNLNGALSTASNYPESALQFVRDLYFASASLNINAAQIWNDDYDSFRNQMSNSERQIFDNLPPNRKMWYMVSAKKALDLSMQHFPTTTIPSNLHNGKGDAFRHAIWNAYCTGFFGATLAQQLTDAHEENLDPNNPFPEKEVEMDLYNNGKGRHIASYSNFTNVEQNVLNYLNTGGLRYLNNLNPNPPYYPTFFSVLIPTNQ